MVASRRMLGKIAAVLLAFIASVAGVISDCPDNFFLPGTSDLEYRESTSLVGRLQW